MKILFCDYQIPVPHTYEKKLIEKEIPGAVFEEYVYEGDEKELYDKVADVDAIMTCFLKIDRVLLEHAPKLKMISVDATGYGDVDVEAAKEKGICVATLGDYCTDEVANHTMALILALVKQLKPYDELIQEKQVYRFRELEAPVKISRQKLAIVGYGRIGRAVAKRAAVFGFEILAVTRHPEQYGKKENGVTYVSVEEALKEADIVSNHMNQTPENEDYFDWDKFCQMKKTAYFVNVGRGACVSETALARALDEGEIAGAGLDVLKGTQPDLEKTNLCHRPNVILTPHSAFYSKEVMEFLAEAPARNVIYYFDGQKNKISNIVC